jgi:RNA polymerase sigma-70 factor (ECF subfamily)
MEYDTLFDREALPHLPALRNFASALCRDRVRTDDLVQDTMLKAWRSFHTYRAGTNCRAWLFQICRHAFINEVRRNKYAPLPLDMSGEAQLNGRDDDDDSRVPRADLSADELRAAAAGQFGDEVNGALQSLPTEYRTVILLNALEGFSYEEIARFACVPIGTVRSRIHRGRKLLADRLARYAAREGFRGSPSVEQEAG